MCPKNHLSVLNTIMLSTILCSKCPPPHPIIYFSLNTIFFLQGERGDVNTIGPMYTIYCPNAFIFVQNTVLYLNWYCENYYYLSIVSFSFQSTIIFHKYCYWSKMQKPFFTVQCFLLNTIIYVNYYCQKYYFFACNTINVSKWLLSVF